jgi:uncharacterized protein (TIGR02266 family)
VVPRGSHRRSAHRVYLRTGVLLRDLRGRTQEGVTGNLGEGGIFVHAPAPFPSGSRLRIRIDLGAAEGGGPVELEGRVTWVRRQGDRRLPGYGVRFTQIDPADRDRIRRLLDMRAVESRRLWMS